MRSSQVFHRSVHSPCQHLVPGRLPGLVLGPLRRQVAHRLAGCGLTLTLTGIRDQGDLMLAKKAVQHNTQYLGIRVHYCAVLSCACCERGRQEEHHGDNVNIFLSHTTHRLASQKRLCLADRRPRSHVRCVPALVHAHW
jgi:hypothetical protein